MRIFVAGATGVIGRSLVRLLIYKGHVVTAMTRSLNRAEWLASLGAQPVTCDIYDARGLQEAVQRAQPDAVVHELTSLPQAAYSGPNRPLIPIESGHLFRGKPAGDSGAK